MESIELKVNISEQDLERLASIAARRSTNQVEALRYAIALADLTTRKEEEGARLVLEKGGDFMQVQS